MFLKRTEHFEALRRAETGEAEPAVKRVSDSDLFKLPGASYEYIVIPKPA